MPFVPIFPQVYQLSSGPVNLWLVEGRDEGGPDSLTLVDTHYQGKENEILDAVRALGKDPAKIRNILLTHCHPDHVGSLAALKKATGAQAWMHAIDARVVRGQASNDKAPVSPGLVNQILFNLFIKKTSGEVTPTTIEHEVGDGDVIPAGGGIRAVFTPGHSSGHLAFYLARDGGILLIGDACSNMMGLDYSIVYNDIAEARRSLAKLAAMDCKAVAFSHGSVLKDGSVGKFKKKWG